MIGAGKPRVVAVLGGDTGPGAELAAGLADLGASVGALGAGDLRHRDSATDALHRLTGEVGGLDAVVVASVGTEHTERGVFGALDPGEWRARVELPLRRTLVCFQAAFAGLGGGGSMVLVVPTLSLTGAAGFVPWAAVTEGQRALAKAAARAWGPRTITVNCVAVPAALLQYDDVTGDGPARRDGPGLDRPGLPPAALAPPDMRADVASVVHALLGPLWRSVTGATVAVDGGVWMAP
jgi:NAD(P)-dependent dehydrogenase (short-subunit alcohol dehydrogenase family)